MPFQFCCKSQIMTGRKTCALQVPPVAPYKALEKFSKALYGTPGSTYSAHVFRPVMDNAFFKVHQFEQHRDDLLLLFSVEICIILLRFPMV